MPTNTPKPFLTWRDQTDEDTAVEVTAHTPSEAARLYGARSYNLARGSGAVDVLVRDDAATWLVHVGIDVEVTFAPARARRIR